MSKSDHIPQINITSEIEEDDDRAILSFAEALTDVEDLFEEDEISDHHNKSRKSKLKIKLPKDDALTDLEDFETSSEEEQVTLIKHNSPIILTDLDIEAPITEESYRKQAKGKKGKRLAKTQFSTRQRSFIQSDESLSIEDNVCTDTEGYETESDHQENIPETEFDLAIYRNQNMVAGVVDSRPSPTVSSNIDYSDVESNLEKFPSAKSNLIIRYPEQGEITDCEILESGVETESETELKKTKPKRRRNKKHGKPCATDVEDLYFSGNERESTSVKRRKRKTKHMLVKYDTMPFESENEDNGHFLFPVCKQVAKKNDMSLRIPELNTNCTTDVEDFEDPDQPDVESSAIDEEGMNQKLREISMGYGEVKEEISKILSQGFCSWAIKRESDAEKEDRDDDSCNSENCYNDDILLTDDKLTYKVKFSPSISNISISRPISNLALPLNGEDPLTDYENIDSSLEEQPTKHIPIAFVYCQEQTDDEEFSDNDEVSMDQQEIELPPPTRNLILIEENDSLVPSIRVLPLDSLEVNQAELIEISQTTDEESISDIEDFTEYANSRATTPDLPLMDGGLVRVRENENTPRNYIFQNSSGSITDTEEVILENKHKRRRAPKFKFMFEKSCVKTNYLSPSPCTPHVALTDTEDLILTDQESETTSRRRSLHIGGVALTDTENIDLSDDAEKPRSRLFSSTPQDLMALEGESVYLREGLESLSPNLQPEINQFVFNGSHNCVTPTTTDSEDMMASAEDDSEPQNLHGASITPKHIHQQLDQMCSSKVHNEVTRIFDADAPEEVMYLKGGGYNHPETDTEFLQDYSVFGALYEDKILFGKGCDTEQFFADFEMFPMAFQCKDWDSSRKPADTTTAPLDKDAAQQEVSCGLTHAEPSLTSTTIVSSPPQPKPRASKPDIPLDFSKALPKTDKILSPVRDDLLDQDESDLASYSDRKTFWENVSKDKTQKRLSLHELSISDKQVISRKRISIHEITQPPIPKPRSAFPSTEVIHQVKSDEIIIAKGRTDADIKLDQAIEAENAHAQQELTSIIEGIESEDKHERVMTEYQASFLPPSERKELFKVTEKSQQSYELEKDDSLDSDKAQKGSSQLIENTGYISDSEDVENVISDSEIEDRVPQIRERQMSVFAPSVTQRKSIYERSASLPTEDLYEVSRNLKQLKEKYEQKIREDLIEEHFVGDNDEECSPERKTLATMQEKRVSIVKSYVDEAKSKINEESFIGDKSFVPIRNDDMLLDYDFQDTELKHEVEFSDDIVSGHDNEMAKISVKELAKSFDKQLSDDMLASKSTSGSYAEESSTSATTEQKDENVLLPAAKKSPSTPDIQKETANNFPTCESDSGILSDGHGYESSISKESMEVHVDKSELEESEKTADNELDTHLQIKTSKLVTLEQGFKEPTEEIPEITVTLSGKQRRISEDSDDYSDKITCDKTDEPAATSKKIPEHMERSKDEKSASKQHDEHVQSILWEAAVETQPNLEEEKVGAIVDLEERTKVAQEFICTEKTLGEKQVLISDTQKSEKIDIDDQEGMTSIEEDEYTQVEHIVKRQSVTDFDKLEEQFKDSHTDAQSALTSIDKSIPDISKIKENISEKLTKELHEKLSEKVKSQDIIIEKAVSEEVDDKTLDDLKELMVEEAFEELQQQKSSERDKTTDLIHNKGDELTSCGVPEESEFGSEIHMDYSDSCASERIKSESHSEIEKIILDTFQHMKVDPDEARKIASKLIEEIENELQNRGELSKSEASEQSKIFDPELSTYIKQLAETNGLDEREVELVESVLARRQRELAKLARGDTQASSMEITDEDLRYSGSELADYTNTLEQQIGQLEAEKINDVVLEYKLQDRDINFHEKTESFEKFEDKHSSEQVFSEGSDAYDDPGANKIKKDLSISVTDNVKGERNFIEHKNVILEEDETISESSTEDHSKIKIQTDALISEVAVTKTDEKQIHSVTSGLVSSESNISVDVQKDVKDIKSDKIEEVLVTDKYNEQESSSIVGQYTADRSSIELIGDVLKEESILVDRQYKESVQQEQIHHKERLSKTETLDSGAEISTKIITDKQHFISSSEVVIKDKSNEKIVTTSSKVLEGTDLVKLLDGDEKFATDSVVSKGETIHRGSSSESKSSADSGKSPDKRNETFGKEHVVLRKSKSEVDSSSSSSNLKPDRRSAVELEAYSSSGESHYQSFEMDSAKSRPCSSDVEGIVAAASSEYETALTSTQEYSTKSHFTSADYHTAISSLSSKESMKSLDSESSGNLASVEVSEHSETLVPSSSDMEGDILEFVDQQILEDGDIQFNLDKHGKPGRQVSDLTDSDIANESIDISEDDQNELDGNAIDGMSKMKRSAEMTFQPEPKILVPESAQLVINDLDEKYGQSLDEGSILSASVSSTSSTGAQRTVIEISERNDGSMAVSGISEHHSLEDNEQTIRGSQESLPLTPTLHKSCDMSTSTPQVCAEMPIDQVTITTSSVKEYGIHSASTQITSETREHDENTITKVSLDEPRRKGHRRTESTVIGISLPSLTLDSKLKESLTDENKERNICESEKDIDEKEETQKAEALSNKEDIELTRPQSSFSKSDARNTVESEFEDIIQSDIIDTTDPFEGPLSPEPHDLPKYNFSGVSMVNASDLESQFSPRLKESIEVQRKWSTSSSISDTSKEILDKRDSHGKSSVTSSEKSSFEEAEAEAAFNMVAHISPAHKVKQIIPILEDEDAEKRELELREKQRKELDRKRAEMRDKSPGFIPDITVTDMTPESDHEDQSEDEEIKPYEQESSDVSQDAHGPSENIIEGSALIQECIKEDLENDSEQGLLQDPIQHDIITSSMMQSTLIDSVVTESNTTELTTVLERPASTSQSEVDSQSSDSFEMLEKPDIIEDFVVIEEVAKEAQEFDTEGQSVKIDKSAKKVKKHDEEIERYLAHSAPTPLTGTHTVVDEFGFEFEDSPPKPDGNGAVASTREYGYEYDRELEANKKWIEQQFQGDQAAMLAAGYGYEMEFERGPLEDIKEEDINDFAASSYGSQKESGGSLGSVKDSYSSTPDYDVLAGRKYFTRSGEQDDISMSSLQEFENLEQAMSLEMRKFHQGQNSDSSSSGSSKTRFHHGKNNVGDDISVNSLKEFEGLEHACIQAHKIEVKAKEEEALLAQIEEGQESIASESESCETAGTEKKALDTEDDEDYEKRMFEIDEIIKQAQTNVERFIDLREIEKTESLGRGDSLEEVSKVPDLEHDNIPVKSTIKVQWKESDDVMIASTDSLDFRQEDEERRDSADSLDAPPVVDIMTASTDSIEFQLKSAKEAVMTDSIEIRDERRDMVSSDSLELGQATSSGLNVIQTDSIEDDGSRTGGHDHSSASTGRDFSSSAREEAFIDHDFAKEDPMLRSIESVDPTSSTATHATMQYETDSVFSGSFTSGGSNTMVSSTDTVDPVQYKETVNVAAAVRKVWFDEDLSGRRTTDYVEDSTPFVSETIEPVDDNDFSHIIHRKVELPPEVHRITFTGQDADEQLQRYMQNFDDGEDVQETQEVDEYGNIHTKRVVRKKFIVKGGEGEHPMTAEDIEDYFRELNKPEVVQDRGIITRSGAKGVFTQEVLDGNESTKTSFTQKIDVPSSGYASLIRPGEEQAHLMDLQQGPSSSVKAESEEAQEKSERDKTRKVTDQHQLSEEMKELLKDLEKESKH